MNYCIVGHIKPDGDWLIDAAMIGVLAYKGNDQVNNHELNDIALTPLPIGSLFVLFTDISFLIVK
jgi:hypothetical protein